MPLTLRPTGLGSGIDKDRQGYTLGSRTVSAIAPAGQPELSDGQQD